MKRDLQQQFFDFTGQDRRSKTWWKNLNLNVCLTYCSWVDPPVILLARGVITSTDGKFIYLSDRFWDINNPTGEELELFRIEYPDLCKLLFKEEN